MTAQRCEFALCRRPAETQVMRGVSLALMVCGLHVGPARTWGIPEPVEQPTGCACDPRHIEVGGYDAGCPVHDGTRGDVSLPAVSA